MATQSLAGTSSGASTAEGGLTVPWVVQDVVLRFVELLKGSLAAQSTAEAVQLLASMQLAGDSAGASALSASLKELIQLKGALTGVSSASTVELKASRSLTGSLTSQSSASAVELQAARSLISDNCQAVSLAWALLSKEGIQEIKGSLTAQSSASAVEMLASRLLVSNKCVGASGLSSDLTVTAPTPEELKGSVSAVSGASAELVRSRVFASDTQSDSAAVGSLIKSLIMAGSATSGSSASGGLSVVTGGWINIVFQGVEAISGQPVYLIGKYKAT